MNPTTLFPSLWQRRAASVSVVGAAVLIVIMTYSVMGTPRTAAILPVSAISAATAALLLSAVAKLPVPDRIAAWFSFTGFLACGGAVGAALLSSTSLHIHSLIVLVLTLLSLVAGLFGPVAWLFLIGSITPYLVERVAMPTSVTGSTNPAYLAFYILPIIASWLFWHKGGRHHGGINPGDGPVDSAYSTLAEQLSQVANESDIVISTIADGVVTLNGKGEISLINPAAQSLVGWSKRDSQGLDFRPIVKLQDAQGNPVPDDLNPIVIALHVRKPVERSDFFLATSANKTFQARLSITPVDGGSGVIIVFRDITAEKAEEREQAEFVSTASHEMRTPVAAIEGYLGLALNPATAAIDDKARSYLTKAHESSQHLGRLFQDLLDVTKADDGRIRNLPQVTDLVSFTGDVASELLPKANEKGLTLTFAPLQETATAEHKLTPVFFADIDPDHLREVMGNLIDNAIKYTRSGSVTVDVTGDVDSVELTVRDSGIGIPREDISHLFQKFYRVDNSDTREIGGTGLGLYLSRRLVELMGGKIWVDSEYGKGSTFTVSLPRLSFDLAQSRLRALKEQRERQAANEASKK